MRCEGQLCARAREWRINYLFFWAIGIVPPRDFVPYANSILCILVSFISHRPDRLGTLASDLKGVESPIPILQALMMNTRSPGKSEREGYKFRSLTLRTPGSSPSPQASSLCGALATAELEKRGLNGHLSFLRKRGSQVCNTYKHRYHEYKIDQDREASDIHHTEGVPIAMTSSHHLVHYSGN